MNKNLLFWCGSIVNFSGLKRYRGSAPSASQWSRGMVGGIMNIGGSIEIFAPIWDSLFPKGQLFPGRQEDLDPRFPQRLVRYLNFPGVRTISVAHSLQRNIASRINAGVLPRAILTYNPYPHHCRALKRLRILYPSIPWINIVLDLDDPETDGWFAYKKATNGCTGSVFLSWWGYKNAPDDRKLHLDGGWDGIFPEAVEKGSKTFVYAGKLGGEDGLGNVLGAIREFRRHDVRFDFFGKGSNGELEKLANEDKRVHIRGFVPDSELENECENAMAFLCPRDLEFQGTKMVFPSKLTYYLRFQKPVICPWMPGLSPSYSDVIVSPTDNLAGGWEAAMCKILNFNGGDRDALAHKIRSLMATKTWDAQATRLCHFINEIGAVANNLTHA